MYHKDKAVQMTSDDHAYKDERRLLIDTSANGHHGILERPGWGPA